MSAPDFILGLVSQFVILAVAYIGLRGKLADLGKGLKTVQKDASEAKKAAVKTESSINNRDSPASDRWDAIHDEAKNTSKLVEDALKVLDRHTSELNSVRSEAELTNKELVIMGGQVRGVRDEVIQLKEDDEQTRSVVRDAISDRNRSINQLRAEIPRIIERKLKSNGETD